MYFFQFRIAVVVMLLNEINIVKSNILNSPFALLLCSLPPPPTPFPPEKKCINCVFHFPWVFQSRTVNVFQALYQTSQTIKMNFEKLLGFRTRFLKAKLQSVLISFTLAIRAPSLQGKSNGSVPQKCPFLRQFSVLGGRCWRNNMFFEGKRCWEKYNSGCLRGFDVKNSCYVLC